MESPGPSPGDWVFSDVGITQPLGHLLLESLHLRCDLENGQLERKHGLPSRLSFLSVHCNFLSGLACPASQASKEHLVPAGLS